ncbi:helix-turn-helix domain-containing protein [Maritalea sp.]|uniref:helix-turn-helix domain-containing protein n=1 Tax=Maritalea sp. TaxID=2003361 RepID=UPI003EF7713F
MQRYLESAPTRRYQRWAEQFWTFEADEEGQAIILPDARSDIIFRYAKNDTHIINVRPVITSPSTTPFAVSYVAGDCWIGVRLRPEQTSAVCSPTPDMPEQTEQNSEDAFAFLKRHGVDIDDLNSLSALKGALESAISKLPIVSFPKWVVSAIDRFHLSGGRISVAQVSAISGVSERHFRREFVRTVRVSPKDYAAIVRFHRALRLINIGGLGVADAAFEAGYADQSHMSRAFQRFGGFSPGNIPKQLSLPGLPI